MSSQRQAWRMVRANLRAIETTAEISERCLPARLLANESFLSPAFLLKEALEVADALEPNRYWLPEVSTDLRCRLADYCSVPAEYVLLGSGADELIQITMLTFLEPGDAVVLPWPAYPMYPYIADVLGVRTVKVSLNSDWTLPLAAIAQAAREQGARLIVLANPNNPTGNLWPLTDLVWLLHNTDCILAVDEAYFEFSGESAVHLLRECDRLIIWRTFSKAFSLAGMRIGYLLADPQLITEIYKARLPFDISNLSQWMAMKALEHLPVFREHVKRTILERERVYEALQRMPCVQVFPSVTNFLLFRSGMPAQALHAALYSSGVAVREVERLSSLLHGCLRVSIGAPSENDLFLSVMSQYFSS